MLYKLKMTFSHENANFWFNKKQRFTHQELTEYCRSHGLFCRGEFIQEVGEEQKLAVIVFHIIPAELGGTAIINMVAMLEIDPDSETKKG